MWPFSKKPAADNGLLPAELGAAIQAASIMQRSATDESGQPRILVSLPRCGHFQWGRDDDSIRASMRRQFTLTDDQERRAMLMLSDRVRVAMREDAEGVASKRPSWRNAWQPLPKIEILE